MIPCVVCGRPTTKTRYDGKERYTCFNCGVYILVGRDGNNGVVFFLHNIRLRNESDKTIRKDFKHMEVSP